MARRAVVGCLESQRTARRRTTQQARHATSNGGRGPDRFKVFNESEPVCPGPI
uniref:Uncharacterized protein n=1 Tax=Setaria italica TaxID=4555 RepID=K3ZG23_SETIT